MQFIDWILGYNIKKSKYCSMLELVKILKIKNPHDSNKITGNHLIY